MFIFGIIILSKFEITPIKKQICDIVILEKEDLEFQDLTYVSFKEDMKNRIIKLNDINSTSADINFFGKLYKIRQLYENSSHIYIDVCEQIKTYTRIQDREDRIGNR
jgi:hypothetical protein